MARLSRPGRDQFAQLPEPARLRVSRVLRARRLSCERQGLTPRDDDSERGQTECLSGGTEAHVIKIDVNDAGRVTGVSYLKGGTEYFQPADVVLLASYTYENVRLLLRSK